MDDILQVLKKLFPILVMVLLMLPSAAASKKRRDARQKGKGRSPEPPPGDSELARRVQKNFEELMRRRSGEAAPAPPDTEPEPWTPPVAAEPAMPSSPPPPRAPRRPPRPARAHVAPRPRPVPRSKVPPAPKAPGHAYAIERDAYDLAHDTAYHQDLASTAGPLRPDRARRILRARGNLDRGDLRRAILLKEILDRPVALRDYRGPTPGA